MPHVLHFDYETFSPLDLRKVGMYRYAEEAEILLLAYAFEGGEVQVVDVAQGESIPQEFLDALIDDETLIYAHNASFERVITKACLGIDIPLHKVRCTAVWAAYLGLPRQLDKLSEVLKLGDKAKLKIGKQLITKFCKPRKPTKKNPSTRLMPADDPVNWELFKEYNRQDVVAEMEVHRKFARWPMPDSEWRMYHKDQEINDRGIRVDMRLVNQAIKLASQEREQLMARAREITNLDNPNSRDQLLAWLETEDVFTQTLTKKDVEQIIGSTTNEVVLELMTIRQQLAKASVKKYEAVARSVCKDGRIRGTLLFYGAGTGRWSGAILQPQNLPSKGLLKTHQIAIAREMLKLDESMIGLLFDDTAKVLSSLLRPMLIPSDGKVYVVADFSAIEARITAWLANETWRLELFARGGKLYEQSAAEMFGIPVDLIVKGRPEFEYRAKAKVAELACFAAETRVLTDRGVVPIVSVTTDDKLWDGIEWVQHRGLINQGMRRVVNLDGVRMTPNQLISLGGFWKEARSLVSSSSTLCRALAIGSENLPCSLPQEEAKVPELCANALAERNPLGYCSGILEKGDQPGVTSAPKSNPLSPESNCTPSMPTQCQTQSIGADWSTGSKQQLPDAPLRMTSSTRATEVGAFESAKSGSEIPERSCYTSGNCRDGTTQISTWIEQTSTKATNPATSGLYLEERTALTNEKSTTSNNAFESLSTVYDIALAGPRNRFTIVTDSGFLIVHNCGYQGWEGALITMGALDMGLTLEELAPLASAWREANPAIEAYWYGCEKAAIRAMQNPQVLIPVVTEYQPVGHAGYMYDGHFLRAVLPNGRELYYAMPKLGRNKRDKLAVSYWGVDSKTKKWAQQWLYGGLMLENICQAVARDCLVESLIGFDKETTPVVFHVHDELIAELENPGQLEDLLDVMATPIPWAPGLLLKGDGYTTEYYFKED